MINLLPQETKRELELESLQKKILIILFFGLIFFLCLFVILFSLGAFMGVKEGFLEKTIIEKEQEMRSAQFLVYKDTIQKSNQELSKVNTLFQEQVMLGGLLEKIAPLTEGGLYFTEVFFKKSFREIDDPKTSQKKKEIFAEVHISGQAQTREALFSFKKKLESEKVFRGVFFQPSSWMKPVNAKFSLGFEFHPVK